MTIKRKIMLLRWLQGLVVLSGVTITVTAMILYRATLQWQWLPLPVMAGFMAWIIISLISKWIRQQNSWADTKRRDVR